MAGITGDVHRAALLAEGGGPKDTVAGISPNRFRGCPRKPVSAVCPLRALAVDLLDVSSDEYPASQMTCDPRRLRLKGLIFRPPEIHRHFLTPHGW